MDNNQDQLRDQSLKDQLERAGAFEELVRSKGWEWVAAYYQTRVQSFTTNVLMSDQSISDFENERQRLMGMKELFEIIQTDIEALERFRKEKHEPVGKEA